MLSPKKKINRRIEHRQSCSYINTDNVMEIHGLRILTGNLTDLHKQTLLKLRSLSDNGALMYV